jgi:hypothetical protein
MPRLLSVNVGLPREVTWNGKTVRTAIWKSPVGMPINTGNAFSDVKTSSSASSEKTSPLSNFLITRSALAIAIALAMRYLRWHSRA